MEVEYEVGSAGAADHGFSDYILRASDGSPIAIVEAKRSSRDALAGKEQARLYAAAIQEHEGTTPFVFLANGDEIWFWDLRGNPRLIDGFLTQEELERRRFQTRYALPLAGIGINGSIVERIYQHEAIRRTHELIENGGRRALWVMATGTGKTRTATALVDTLIRARRAQRVLFLVDRNALATQALDAFREFLPGEPAERLEIGSYDRSKRLYVTTFHTLQDSLSIFSPGDFDVIIADECHRSIYNKWKIIVDKFDALLIGLTATPSDFIDRNTFEYFDCAGRVPTFSYELQQAIDDGHLVPFEAYHARTTIQVNGIRGNELSPAIQEQLRMDGVDPEDINFAGTDLERKVTNRETTRLLVSEFVESAILEPNSGLPGKSIIFAMSHAHARRIWEAINRDYPQFPGLAEIIDSHMERPDFLLSRFKRESYPRIAISVDMLDTGVDVPSVVNLGFMKPVFSRIKFWQMVGRGTRKVEGSAGKPWCPAGTKTSYRILDFWGNFERFQINPNGIEPTSTVPVGVRYFRQLSRLAYKGAGLAPDVESELVAELQGMIEALPLDSGGVRQERQILERCLLPAFWSPITENNYQILTHTVAPLMRYLPNVDVPELVFALHCIEGVEASLLRDEQRLAAASASIWEDIRRLPVDHPDLRSLRADIRSEISHREAPSRGVEEFLEARAKFASYMRLRESELRHTITLDIEDDFLERRSISVGPDGLEFDAGDYRNRVESRVRELSQQHAVMLKLSVGEQLDADDFATLERLLAQPDLYITEESLQQTYLAPEETLLSLLRHALGVEPLHARADAVMRAVNAYVSSHQILSADKLTFVRLFARRLIQVGRVSRVDLLRDPFTRLGTVVNRFTAEEMDSLFALSAEFEG